MHQFSHRFATELKTSFLKLTMDPPVPITSPVFMEDGGYELRYLRAENAYLKAMQEHLLEKKRQELEKKRKSSRA
ncbi:hypothetical protein AWF89_13685 [Escherichia coli]|nr:hypothetical protein AWF89_13685 [Escherichia coli]